MTRRNISDLAGAMFMRPPIKIALRLLFKWLILCAVLFNVSIPAGAMLERSVDGKMQVVICSAQGMLNAWLDVETGEMVVDGDQTPDDTPDDAKMPSECPMASPSPLADNAGAPSVKVLVRITLPFRTKIGELPPIIGQSPARLSARGPPISV